jgi:hypothetical protein
MMEHDFEPVRGLPERLPAGETMLWQGSPSIWALATQVFHIRVVGAYFTALALWAGVSALAQGKSLAAHGLGWLVLAGLAGVSLLALFAWLYQRSTIYSITNKRVVLRIGVAVPKAINIPYAIVKEAKVQRRTDGSGDIALALTGKDRIAYAHLWPHVRPWGLSDAEPALRCLADVQAVARVLAQALADAKAPAAQPPTPVETPIAPSFSEAPALVPANA